MTSTNSWQGLTCSKKYSGKIWPAQKARDILLLSKNSRHRLLPQNAPDCKIPQITTLSTTFSTKMNRTQSSPTQLTAPIIDSK